MSIKEELGILRQKLKAKSKGKIPIVCPKCGSSHNYRRISTGEQVCQKCGHVWKVKEK